MPVKSSSVQGFPPKGTDQSAPNKSTGVRAAIPKSSKIKRRGTATNKSSKIRRRSSASKLAAEGSNPSATPPQPNAANHEAPISPPPKTPNRRRPGQTVPNNAGLPDGKTRRESAGSPRSGKVVVDRAAEDERRRRAVLRRAKYLLRTARDRASKEQQRAGTAPMSSASAMSPPEGNAVVGGDAEKDSGGGRQRKQKRKQRKKDAVVDEKLRIKRRVKTLVNRIRMEQNLIDAYAGEGWKGNSREKIRPEKELQRAEMQISRCKLAIRELIRDLHNLGMEGCLDESAFDEQGEIFHEEIFCAKCRSQEASVDNDIILCDGACNRGFHQNCLEPPLATADIPPVDESWLCAVCDAKVECLNYINGYMGTEFNVDDRWESIFPAAVRDGDGGASNAMAEDWPSEDSEDEDYDPERKAARNGDEGEQQAPGDGGQQGAPPELSIGSESEPEASSGSGTSSDDESRSSEVSGDELEHSERRFSREDPGSPQACESVHLDRDPEIGLDPSGGEEDDVVLGKRQRKPVDYKKLHDEMFGKEDEDDDVQSADEEWGPKRIRGAREKPPQGLNGVDKTEPTRSMLDKEQDSSVQRKAPAGQQATNGKASHHKQKKLFNGQQSDPRPWKRLPDGAVERLREEFETTCFPSRADKERIAQKLGMSFRQVNGWFQNARHAVRKGQTTGTWALKQKSHLNAASIRDARGREGGVDDIEATNGLLIEKLEDVQLKLHYLKQTLEAMVAKPDVGSESLLLEGSEQPQIFDGGVVMTHSDGKHILYVPVAEVIEKDAV